MSRVNEVAAVMSSTQTETKDWYKAYYLKNGEDRNDLLTNPEVLFQYLAFEYAVISALRQAKTLNRTTSRVLDVGCGNAGSLMRFMQLGFMPEQLSGIDVLPERIEEGRRKCPNIDLICGDASSMPFEAGAYDLVCESTMFVQITDDELAQNIACEMLRVTKPNGYVLLIDWRYGKPGNKDYRAVSRKRVSKLFSVGSLSDVICRVNGALVPPIGRFVSAHLPAAYFPLSALFPFLVGSNATLLKKRVL